MSFRAGRMRDRITIRRATDVQTGAGGLTRSWTTLASSLPAEVLGQSGRESVIGNTLQGISTFKLSIRHRTDIRAGDQVLLNGLELNILGPPYDPTGRRQRTEFFADTSAPQGAGE